jgi:hypothetical protein
MHGVRGGPSRSMAQPIISSGRSRIALLSLGFSALLLALPLSALADGKHHGKRHGNHSRGYYQSDDRYYGPPPCREHKRVKVYHHHHHHAVPVAVPVYPAYPQAYPEDYDRYDSKPVVRIGVDWVIGF